MIERIQLTAPAHADSEFNFSFRAPLKLPSPMLRLDRVAVGYGHKPQLSGIKLGLEPGVVAVASIKSTNVVIATPGSPA